MTLTRCLLVTMFLGLLPTTTHAQPTDEVRYFHLDAIGSVRLVTDASGQVFNWHDYRPFGDEWPTPPPPSSNVRRFAGNERDVETGFDYFGARYYRGASGRFTTVDPLLGIETALTDPQRWNRYSYVGNRPTQLVDPDGRGWASALFKVGKALVRGTSATAEFAGAASDVGTLIDSEGTLLDRGLAFGSLVSEVALPISARDAGALVSFIRGGIGPVRSGQVGESAVRAATDIGSKIKIAINGRNRIPDGLTESVVSEVKNVGRLSYSLQLRDFAEYARSTGREFVLYVRRDVRLSGPLQDAIKAGDVKLRFIDEPK